LTEGPQDATPEQNIPLRDRWHVRRYVRRSFSQLGTDEQEPAKLVSPKACRNRAFGLKN
jgi:hypothetical protein